MKRLTLQQHAARRGQTLVMFAFIILLVTLMVMMTLSFATKAHEKMQLQQVADQAAYSNAVVTARTFNSIAILNRVQIAHMVAMAGIQAAVSYAGLFMGFLNALEGAFITSAGIAAGACGASLGTCSCCCNGMIDASAALGIVTGIYAAATAAFTPIDLLAGWEIKAYQFTAMAMFGFEETAFDMLRDRLSNQSLTREIVANASAGKPEWTVPKGGSSINIREVGSIASSFGGLTGAAMEAIPFVTNRASVLAAMASRGNWWVTARIGELGAIQRRLFPVFIASNVSVFITMPTFFGLGNAYFGPTIHSAYFPTDASVWADDHGNGMVFFMRGCTPPLYPLTAAAWAQAGWASIHMWYGNGLLGGHAGGHLLANTSITGVWPPYIDYNFTKVTLENDAYGQPKNFAVVQRDYRKRSRAADPWNLSFRYQFSNSGTGSSYGQGPVTDPNAIILQDGTDVSLQTAISTGITYYHRFNHWSEPPNLFNPFWRAGLSRANIDPKPLDGLGRDWQEDVEDALNSSGVPWAAQAVGSLQVVGYSGVQ